MSFWNFSVEPKHLYLCICVLSTSGLGQSVLNLCILECVCVYPEPKRDPASMTEDDSLIYGKAISRMTTATECVLHMCMSARGKHSREREGKMAGWKGRITLRKRGEMEMTRGKGGCKEERDKLSTED